MPQSWAALPLKTGPSPRASVRPCGDSLCWGVCPLSAACLCVAACQYLWPPVCVDKLYLTPTEQCLSP